MASRPIIEEPLEAGSFRSAYSRTRLGNLDVLALDDRPHASPPGARRASGVAGGCAGGPPGGRPRRRSSIARGRSAPRPGCGQRSRATVMAQTPPARRRRAGHRRRRRASRRSSSTSSTRIDPAADDGRSDGGRTEARNAPATLVGAARRSRSNWAIVARAPLEDAARTAARAREPPTSAMQRCLVVAALARPIGVDRDRHDEVAAGPGPPPALGDSLAERDREPPLTGVLQRVERAPDDPGERRAPLELERAAPACPPACRSGRRRAGRGGRRAPGRHAAQIGAPSRPQPGHAAGSARSSSRAASVVIGRASHHRAHVDRPAPLTGARLTQPVSDPRCCRGCGPPATGRRRPCRSGRSCRPAAPATPCAPRTSGTMPATRGSARWTDTTCARRRRSGRPTNTAVDRESHEHHVDAVAVRQPQARLRRAGADGPSGP